MLHISFNKHRLATDGLVNLTGDTGCKPGSPDHTRQLLSTTLRPPIVIINIVSKRTLAVEKLLHIIFVGQHMKMLRYSTLNIYLLSRH